MPQYPVPPWPADYEYGTGPRRKIRVDHPRWAHMPIVHGNVDGTITVTRGTPDAADTAAASPEAERLFEDDAVGKPHLLISNRRGDTRLWPVWKPTATGWPELAAYSSRYDLMPAIADVNTLDDLRDALRRELENLDALAADGWEFTTLSEEAKARPFTGTARLVDTHRPDEDLSDDPQY